MKKAFLKNMRQAHPQNAIFYNRTPFSEEWRPTRFAGNTGCFSGPAAKCQEGKGDSRRKDGKYPRAEEALRNYPKILSFSGDLPQSIEREKDSKDR
jgi:hypothetical protein